MDKGLKWVSDEDNLVGKVRKYFSSFSVPKIKKPNLAGVRQHLSNISDYLHNIKKPDLSGVKHYFSDISGRIRNIKKPNLPKVSKRGLLISAVVVVDLLAGYLLYRNRDFIYEALKNNEPEVIGEQLPGPGKNDPTVQKPVIPPKVPKQKDYIINEAYTDAKIGIPENAIFDPRFSFEENYKVRLTPEIRRPTLEERTRYGLEDETYMVIVPGNEDYARKYRFDATGMIIKDKDGNEIAKAFSDIGDTMFIPIDQDMIDKIGDASFEVLALRKIGNTDHYDVVASYRNGVIGKPNIDLDDIVTMNVAEDSFSGWYEAGYSFKASSNSADKTPLVQKYLDARDPYGFIMPMDGETFKTDFKDMIFEVADTYKTYSEAGMTHSESLNEALNSASMYGVNTKNDVLEALLLAQRMGHDVTIKRWNSRLFDDSQVATYIGERYASMYGMGMRVKDIFQEIKKDVAKDFGHTMSDTTLRKYLKMF